MQIAEPDRPVGCADVVGRAQPLPLIAVGEDGDPAIDLGAGDAAMAVRAANQPALAVTIMAICET
jgi:hypothetical protein